MCYVFIQLTQGNPSLHLQGLSNGVENDQNTANQLHPGELPPKRLSTSSTTSNQSYDSTAEYAVPKPAYTNNHRNSEDSDYYNPKITNPLFGVNAASHYAPGAIKEEAKHYERAIPNGVRKAPEGQDNEPHKVEDAVDGRKDSTVSANQIALTEGGTATYTTDNNGKINVHVTVMINAGNYMHPYRLYDTRILFAHVLTFITIVKISLTVFCTTVMVLKRVGTDWQSGDLEDAYYEARCLLGYSACSVL